MKNLKTIIFASLLLAAVSCTKNQDAGSGQVSFEVNGNLELADVTKSNVSDYTTLPSAEDFNISVLDATSAPVFTGKISEWNPATVLLAGNYTVTAEYGSLEEEGFDKPYFQGSASFAITGNQTTAVKIPVSLANTVVKVACTDNLKNYYSDYTFSVCRENSTIATFVKGETKAAFVDGYKLTLKGEIQSNSGKQAFEKEYTNLDEATAYTFLFDASNVGGSKITVSFNNTVETIDLGDIEINE